MLMQARRVPPPVTQGMTMKKTATVLEGQAAVGMALTTGGSRRATARKMMAPYHPRVTANRNRLMRKASDTQACKSQHQERLLRALR